MLLLIRIIKIPIITPSIHDPELADKLIGEGETDMVSLGRQLLADPEAPWALGSHLRFDVPFRLRASCPLDDLMV